MGVRRAAIGYTGRYTQTLLLHPASDDTPVFVLGCTAVIGKLDDPCVFCSARDGRAPRGCRSTRARGARSGSPGGPCAGRAARGARLARMGRERRVRLACRRD